MAMRVKKYCENKRARLKSGLPRLGFILYRGPSAIDGAPIVVVATRFTKNDKTGNMYQTWILRADMHPIDAAQTGADLSICGNCAQRPYHDGACYVNIGQAPAAVYKALKYGAYADYTQSPDMVTAAVTGRKVRLGAYGDPAAIPFESWLPVIDGAREFTGYTHQAPYAWFDWRFKAICMLSADTPKQASKYQKKGARTFRVKTESGDFMPGEIECLSDSDGMQCADCLLCDGARDSGDYAPNIAINAHGAKRKRFNGADLIARG